MKRFKQAREIKAGVVGYGASYDMGKIHLREIQQAGMAPTAVAARRAERREAARRDFPGIETYGSLAEMLEQSNVDLVVIATPNDTHASLAIQALRAGRHVVCEKPMALTTADCDAMIAAARRANRVLSVYHNRHWDPHIIKAVAHVRAGRIGQLVRVEGRVGGYERPPDNWYGQRSRCGGIAYSWGPHLLEYAFQLIDSEMVEVTGLARRGYWAGVTGRGADCLEDEAVAIVRFANGVWFSLLTTSIDSRPRPGIFDITGTDGSYVMDWGSNELWQHRNRRIVSRRYRNRPGPHWSQGRHYYRNLADHLTRGAELAITAEWSRRTVHVLDLAARSARLGRALRTKYG